MVSEAYEKRNRSFFSLATLGNLGLTAAFFGFFYLIWTTSLELETQLRSSTDEFAVAHNLQVEYKMEVQEWKDLLLRSTDAASLQQNWKEYEQQYRKVADAASSALQRSDVQAVNEKLRTFLNGHEANRERYQASADLFARSGFDVHKADAEVKGIDRPLLAVLEEADAAMQHEKELIDAREIARARNRIEQSLIALALIALVVVWRPRN